LARVLVIDACPEFRERARFILRSAGHDTIEARDGLAGLQCAIEDAPDGVLVDAGLPGLDGIDICGRLAGAGETRAIPLLVWSTDASEAMRVRALRSGAWGFVSRRASADVLHDALDALLGRASVAHEAPCRIDRPRAAFLVCDAG